MTFDAMKGVEKQKRLLEKSKQWQATQIRSTKKIKEKAKLYKGKNLSESQARKLLHSSGLETFPIPQGIKENDFLIRISNNGRGMKYFMKNNEHFNIRIMPGNPNSPNIAQRKPYVIHKTPKGAMNNKGNHVKADSFEAHIPLNEYDFKKLEKAYYHND